MIEKGEFEQRPEMKPANEVPFVRPKASKLPWVLCAIFTLVAVGAIGYIACEKLSGEGDTKAGDETKCAEMVESDTNSKTDESAKNHEVGLNGFVAYAEYGYLYVTKDGKVYLDPSENIDSRGGYLGVNAILFDEKYAPGKFGTYKLTNNDIVGYKFSTIDGNTDETEFSGYDLGLENIIAAYNVSAPQHQWWGWTTVFIDKDGNTSWMYVDPNYTDSNSNRSGKASAKLVKNYSKYSNIASVLSDSFGYGKLVLVTKDGGHIIVDNGEPFKK